MNRALRLALAAVVLTVPGCRVDFTEPTVRGPWPATLHLSLRLEPRVATGWEVDVAATLSPGMGDDGMPRRVPDDTLRLGDYALTPRDTMPGGVRTYWEQWPRAVDLDLGTLTLHAPPIDPIAGVPTPVSFSVQQRVGPDTLAIAVADTIALVTDPGTAPSRPPDDVSWSLSFSSPSGMMLARQGTDEPPSTLMIPTGWLEWADGEPVTARLYVDRRWFAEVGESEYRMGLRAASLIQWTLVWHEVN